MLNKSLAREACYINGQWVTGKSTFSVTNPATGEVLGTVPNMGKEETTAAINAAVAAWPEWKKRTAQNRGEFLHKWADLITENSEELARILTLEQGKPLAEAKGEIAAGISSIRWSAEEARRAYGEVIPTSVTGRRPLALRQPIGVVAAITPWNFPSSMLTRKAPPALAAGCPVVIKPASMTPYSAIALVALAEQAGFPAGVINLVTGSATEIGLELSENKDVRALSFTGSTSVGKQLMRQCAGTVKKVSMELGGNAPFIVFDDANVKKAAEAAVLCKFRNAGQTCICANRIFVQEGIYNEFMQEFIEGVKALVTGNGFNPETTVGPLISEKAADHVQELLTDALAKGARLEYGGKRLDGSFFQPTVISGLTTKMRIFHEEIFGPVAPIMKFSTEKEVIQLANETEYGLASYLFSTNIGRVWRVGEALEYGMVGVNEQGLSTSEIPFGGVKESGLGRENGKWGVEEYLEVKYLLLGGIGE